MKTTNTTKPIETISNKDGELTEGDRVEAFFKQYKLYSK